MGGVKQTEGETDTRGYGRKPDLCGIMPRGGEDEVTLSIYLIFRKYLILLS